MSYHIYRAENLQVAYFLPFFWTSNTSTCIWRYDRITIRGPWFTGLPLQPAYFVYLLRSYCMSPAGAIIPTRFISLANSVLLVFLASLGPFMLMGQLPQLLSRLFPFTRGLNHAYWAPNAWALVTAADRVLLQRSLFINYPFTPELTLPSVVKHLNVGLTVNESGVASTSRGLVGDTVFAVIPNIKPVHTFIITIIFQMVGKITQLAGLSDIGSGLSYQAMESADL